MKLSASEFRELDGKAVTLLGMSGVGKTRLARILRQSEWFHYSGDYRIGTHYLDEEILDDVKREAMTSPLLRDLLRSDSIHVANNLSIDNLKPLSSFLGKVGNPELGGRGLREFKRRQDLHRRAEIAAMYDVPSFIRRSREIYGYRHFVNDAGGSLCELDDSNVLACLAEHTIILYIDASDDDRKALERRAEEAPKPLYFREQFLDEHLSIYMEETGVEYVAQINPDEFSRWVFPRLIQTRIPRYLAIAERHGYVVASDDINSIEDEADFIDLVARALDSRG